MRLCMTLMAVLAIDRMVVEVTAFVSHGFEHFTLFDPRCESKEPGVWLEYGGRMGSRTIYCCGVLAVKRIDYRAWSDPPDLSRRACGVYCGGAMISGGMNRETARASRLVDRLGPERALMRIDEEWLVIHVDRAGVARRMAVVRD